MLSSEPYIIVVAVILIIGLLYFAIRSIKKFELVVLLFTCSTLVASFFYSNEPEWINEAIETGLGGYLRGIILIFSGILGLLFYLLKARGHKYKVPLHLLLLLGFALYNFASIFYSIDQSNTLIRSSLFASSFLFLLGFDSWLETKKDLNKVLNILFLLVTVFIIINVASIFIVPSRVWWWKAPARFIGLSSHPNALGGFAVISFPILLWKFYQSKINTKYFILLILLLNFILLILTGSRTSLAVALIVLITWFLVKKDWVKIIVVLSFIILSLMFFSQFGFSSYERAEGTNIYNLTEREYIWEGALLFAKNKPITGYGYSVESKIFADQYIYDIEGTGLDINPQGPLHNGYLSILIGGGIIGLLLFLAAIGLPIYFLIKSKISDYKAYALATLAAILLANFVESAVIGYFSPTDLFFWIAWVIGGKISIIDESIKN